MQKARSRDSECSGRVFLFPAGCSMKTMFAILFQAYLLTESEPSAAARNGPCSLRKPVRPEQPGPPLVQSTSGSLAGSRWLSTNQ